MPYRLSIYISKSFAGTFFPLFFILFTISSVVAIIRLADITAIVKLSSVDFLTLYIYGVPQLFFYSMPISFFIAASLALSKLSFDSEITAMVALGATKRTIMAPLVLIAATLSLILLYLGLVGVPMSNAQAKNFVEEKKATSKLNLEANSVGQKFGDWLIFALSENKNGSFGDVVLFSKSFKSQMIDQGQGKSSENKIIYSKMASVVSDNGLPVLELKHGSAILYDDNTTIQAVKKLVFDRLSLREELKDINVENGHFLEYWLVSLNDTKRAKDFADTVLVSLAPILTVFLSFALGVGSYRKEKNRSVAYSVIAISAYYLLILVISPKITFLAIPVIILLWSALTYMLYKRSLFSRY